MTVTSDTPVLPVTGDLDHMTGPLLLQRAVEALGRNGSHILLDLEDCSFVGFGMTLLLPGSHLPSSAFRVGRGGSTG